MRKDAPCDPSVATLVKLALEVHSSRRAKKYSTMRTKGVFVAVLF